ncbi:hypothetical protein ACJX0J_042534, partial [Zea mays]
CPLRL